MKPIDDERQARELRDSVPAGAPDVQITGHLDEVDAPVWEFINAEARKLGPLTGSIDSYNFARPNGSQPNGVVVVLWNGQHIHAVALTVRDAMNRTQCVRLIAAAPTVKAEQVQCDERGGNGAGGDHEDDCNKAPSLPASGSAIDRVVATAPERVVAYRTLDRHGNPVTDWIDGSPEGGKPIVSGGSFQLAYAGHQSAPDAPERVSVPAELLGEIDRCLRGDRHYTTSDKLRALLNGGEA
jgi:hypothetical protein